MDDFVLDLLLYIKSNVKSTFNFIHSFLSLLGLLCCTGFSLPVVGGGYSLVAVLAASLFVKHRHEGTSTSVVAAPGR